MVEYASTFLMSRCTNASTAPMRIVMPPISAMRLIAAAGDREALEEDRVQARDEEHAGDDHGGGVDQRRHRRGAGHRVGEPGVERELAALADDADEQADRAGEEQPVVGASARARTRLMPSMLKVPAAKNVMMMPIIRPMSPVRVVRNALSAASEFAPSSHQCPMSANEQSPTPSQPTSSCSVFSDDDEQQHRRGEEAQHRVVVRVTDVASHVRGRVDVHEQRDRA